MYQCSVCEYESMYKFNVDRHEKAKHSKPNSTSLTISNNVTHQTGSGAEQSIPSYSQNEKHSNMQEENIDQSYENIEQYQRLQQEEKVTTYDDGRPSHVSIQLFDKYCKGLTDYMHYCQGLINLCQRVHTEKEQQLDRFCTAWEDLKWERDTFAKEINRRDCCGEGVINKNFAKKIRSGKYRGCNH